MSAVYKAEDDSEKRYAPARFVVDDDAGRRPIIRGMPIVFNSLSLVLHDERIGWFREVINPEAVDRTLRGARPVKALWDHQGGKVIGSTKNGSLLLRKTSTGLSMELEPTPEWWATPELSVVRSGAVDGMSFAFSVVDGGERRSGEDENGIPIREILDMTFSEISIVAFPAYPSTTVSVSQRSIGFFQQEMCGGGVPVEWLRMVHKTRLV